MRRMLGGVDESEERLSVEEWNRREGRGRRGVGEEAMRMEEKK